MWPATPRDPRGGGEKEAKVWEKAAPAAAGADETGKGMRPMVPTGSSMTHVKPRMSFDFPVAESRGAINPAMERPKMKLHMPKLPKKLASLLEEDTSVKEKELGKHDIVTTGTKVIVTIGPACQDVEILCDMIRNGMSCARIDLTNGDIEFHVRSIRNVMQAASIVQQMVAIMVDTVGPEIFVKSGDPETYIDGWPKWGKGASVKTGDTVTLTDCPKSKISPNRWPVTYENFAQLCKVGDVIIVGRYLSTGMEGTSVTLEVTAIVDEHDVQCVALNDAELSGLITVFIKNCSLTRVDEERQKCSLPILSSRDVEILKILSTIKNSGSDCIDFLSLSYANCKEHIIDARQTLDSLGLSNAKVIAKVETGKALANFENILHTADGIIISRGNLGMDISVELFPVLQKALIQACNSEGKPVLTTRVVDSMTSSPRPTRAEATDISNAVLDGVDGIILGAETLRGLFPVLTVKTVLLCAKQAEKTFDNTQHFSKLMKTTGFLSQLESMASSTVRVADKIQAGLIVVVTGSGRTARLVAKYRPDVPVIALTVPRIRADAFNRWHYSGRHQARQSMIVRGLYPMLAVGTADEGGIMEDCVERAASLGIARPDQNIVILYNPPGSEVPVIKLVSVDRQGQNLSRRFSSVANNMFQASSGVTLVGGSSGSESSFNEDDVGVFP